MASISRDAGGTRRIQFVAGDGSRKAIRLGKVSQKQAAAFLVKVDAIISARITGSMDQETSLWIAERDDRTHAKLAAVGLVEPREARVIRTIGDLVDTFFSAASVKASTITSYKQASGELEKHFGRNRKLPSITALEGDLFAQALRDGDLSSATASKRIKVSRQMFARGVKWGMLPTNPMRDVKAGSMANRSRQLFIDRPTVAKLIDACPDAEWRALVVLSRFGGLRVPSEALELTWGDVDWAGNRLHVRSSKTEHTEGGGVRVLPLFPELREHLLKLFEQAAEGSTHVITRYRRGSNLNPQLRRIIKSAGLAEWPRAWHNMRASRATELVAEHPSHVAASWLGHTEAVADAHYRQVRQEDFDRAITGGADSGARVAQNPAQQPSANSSEVSQDQTEVLTGCANARESEDRRESSRENRMAPVGLEPTLPLPEKGF